MTDEAANLALCVSLAVGVALYGLRIWLEHRS